MHVKKGQARRWALSSGGRRLTSFLVKVFPTQTRASRRFAVACIVGGAACGDGVDGLRQEEEFCFIVERYSGAALIRPALELLRDVAAAGAGGIGAVGGSIQLGTGLDGRKSMPGDGASQAQRQPKCLNSAYQKIASLALKWRSMTFNDHVEVWICY
ncbi:MAG: hypothetical protein NTW86_04550 [Candidatus Sumerlaeota bacterium]|nr:hypothetical protein [Candidatus Sumerlaeota bacterium]